MKMPGYQGFDCGRPELIGSSREEIHACIRIFPHKLDGEGHFVALFQKDKRGEAEHKIAVPSRSGLKGEEKKLFDAFAKNLNRKFEPNRLESRRGMVYYMPELLPELRGLRFLRCGLFVGEIKKNRFEPSQSLAMALRAEDYKNCLILSSEDERVTRYLKGRRFRSQKRNVGEKQGGSLCV